MKNIQIKSYSLKKNSVLNKNKNPKSPLNYDCVNTNSIKPGIDYTSLTSNVFTDVDKLLKSPGLNFSLSKYDDSGNRLDINFCNDRIKNIPPNAISQNTYLSTINSLNKEDKHENKINIKLKFKSEVINNNIRIKEGFKKEKSSIGVVTPNSSKEKKMNNLNYYLETLNEKDKVIETLSTELHKAKLLIRKLMQFSQKEKENSDVKELDILRSNSAEYSYGMYNTLIKNNNKQFDRKSIINLDISNELVDKYNENEHFSDHRNSSTTNNLLKSMSSGNKEQFIIQTSNYMNNPQMSFRHSNKTTRSESKNIKISKNNQLSQTHKAVGLTKIMNNFTNNSNISTTKVNSNINLNKSGRKEVKQIDEILKTTMKLIEDNKIKEDKKGIVTRSQDMNENLKLIKMRTKKILNSYINTVQILQNKQLNDCVNCQQDNNNNNFSSNLNSLGSI